MKNMKKGMAVFLALAFSVSLIACGKSGKDSKDEENGNPKDVEVNSQTTDDEKIFEELFDINNTVSIQLNISDEELNKLQSDYEEYDAMNSKSPIYRKVDKAIISIGDEVYEIEEVGIKLKGNTSKVPVYDEETGKPNLSHYKLSFNETFDDAEHYGDESQVWESDEIRQERKDRRFATLKTMEVKWNKNYDDTHIREWYANEIYREAGVLAQHVNICSLGINGENYGVVNIYEPVDQIFIEKNLPKEEWGGDLYKCGWTFKPANYVESAVTYGVEDKDEGQFFNYDLKTNEKESDFSTLTRMLEVINSSEVTKEDFDSVVDGDYLVKYLAASYFVGNPDDMRNNYNNHYIYFLKSSGRAIFIPYDTDRCLGITYGWNPDETGMTEMLPFDSSAAAGKGNQKNPLINLSILDGGFYIDEYKEKLAAVSSSDYWKEDVFESYYEIAKQNYEAVVSPTVDFANADMEFKFSLEGEFTTADECNMSFEEYVTRIMNTFNSSQK